jgi:Family of unknown function (DUF6338)
MEAERVHLHYGHRPAVFVECFLDDGSRVIGKLLSFNPLSDDVADRDLVLEPPLQRMAPGAVRYERLKDAGTVVVSSRRLVSMAVSYSRHISQESADSDEAAGAAGASATTGPGPDSDGRKIEGSPSIM